MKRAMTPDGNESWPIGYTTLQLGEGLFASRAKKPKAKPDLTTTPMARAILSEGVESQTRHQDTLWAVGIAGAWTEVCLLLDGRLTGKGENVRRVSIYMGEGEDGI